MKSLLHIISLGNLKMLARGSTVIATALMAAGAVAPPAVQRRLLWPRRRQWVSRQARQETNYNRIYFVIDDGMIADQRKSKWSARVSTDMHRLDQHCIYSIQDNGTKSESISIFFVKISRLNSEKGDQDILRRFWCSEAGSMDCIAPGIKHCFFFYTIYFLYVFVETTDHIYSANAKAKSIRATNIARNRTSSLMIDEIGNFFDSTRTFGPPLSMCWLPPCHFAGPQVTSALGGNLHELALRALPLPFDWS